MPVDTWYKSWFNSPYYHLLYRGRDTEEAGKFIDVAFKYLNPAKGSKILDLACGKGRHSIYMASKGFDITGIDLSEQNIASAKKFEHEHLHFCVHDMLLPFRENEFDLVLNLFTSFGYFDSMQENLRTLQSAHINLKPRGTLLIDFLNLEYVRANLVSDEKIEIEGVKFEISRTVESGSIKKHIKVQDGSSHWEFEERIKALNKQDFMGMLLQAGFTVEDVFGDYALGQFNEVLSPRLILVARKKR